MTVDAVRARQVRHARIAIFGPAATGLVGVVLIVAGTIGYVSTRESSARTTPVTPSLDVPATPPRDGFALVGADGRLYPLGDLTRPPLATSSAGADAAAAAAARRPRARIVGAAGAFTGGVWMAATDGHVYAVNAPALGDVALGNGAAPVVGIASAADGHGYRVARSDGHVFTLGAPVRPEPAVATTKARVVGIAAAPTSDGYWLARSDGTVVAVGAPRLGGVKLAAGAARVVGIAATPDGRGYWLATSDGHVYAFGAPFRGDLPSTHVRGRVVGIAGSSAGGYWLTGADGRVYTFGAQPSSLPSRAKPSAPIVAIIPY